MANVLRFLTSVSCVLALAGCQAVNNWQPTAGPTKRVLENQVDTTGTGLTIIEIDNQVANLSSQTIPVPQFPQYHQSDSTS